MTTLHRRDAPFRPRIPLESCASDDPCDDSGWVRVVPRRMQYCDLPAVYDTMRRANAHDPLQRFLLATPDSARACPLRAWARAALFHVRTATETYARLAWVVQDGAAYMRLGYPFQPKPWLARMAERTASWATRWVLTAQQRARRAEFLTKLRGAVRRLGTGARRRMVEVAILMTAPECQGRGYASALVRVATGLADAHGVSSFVVSSNVANRGFYRGRGFEVVATFFVGDDPTWDGEPVPVDLMVRECEKGNLKGMRGEAE